MVKTTMLLYMYVLFYEFSVNNSETGSSYGNTGHLSGMSSNKRKM